MRILTFAVIIISTMVLTSPIAIAQESPVPVYVFTKHSEFVDVESKGRADSMADLLKSLAKKKPLRLVDSASESKVQIEVIRRGNDQTGDTRERTTRMPAIAGGGTTSTRTEEKNYTVHAVLTVGTYSIPIVGQTEGILWRAAADDVAKKVERWMKENQAQLR